MIEKTVTVDAGNDCLVSLHLNGPTDTVVRVLNAVNLFMSFYVYYRIKRASVLLDCTSESTSRRNGSTVTTTHLNPS